MERPFSNDLCLKTSNSHPKTFKSSSFLEILLQTIWEILKQYLLTNSISIRYNCFGSPDPLPEQFWYQGQPLDKNYLHVSFYNYNENSKLRVIEDTRSFLLDIFSQSTCKCFGTACSRCSIPYNPSLEIKLRRGKAKDYKLYADLYPDIGVEGATPSKQTFIIETLPTLIVIEAMQDDIWSKPVGYLFPIHYDKVYYILFFVVENKWRSKKIGRRAMEKIIERVKSKKEYLKLGLDCDVTHNRVYSFYASFGMKFVYKEHYYKIEVKKLFDRFSNVKSDDALLLNKLDLEEREIGMDEKATLDTFDEIFGIFNGFHRTYRKNNYLITTIHTKSCQFDNDRDDGKQIIAKKEPSFIEKKLPTMIALFLHLPDTDNIYIRSRPEANDERCLIGLVRFMRKHYNEEKFPMAYFWVRNNEPLAEFLERELGGDLQQSALYDYLELSFDQQEE